MDLCPHRVVARFILGQLDEPRELVPGVIDFVVWRAERRRRVWVDTVY
jgi:hypothetical protein